MKQLVVPATLDRLEEVLSFVGGCLEAVGAPMKLLVQMNISVEEIFVNICHYAYPNGTGEAEIDVELEDGEVVVCFKDSGVPYNPLARNDPDVTLAAEERAIGGLGILMVKKSMDRVEYRHDGKHNVFLMAKRM